MGLLGGEFGVIDRDGSVVVVRDWRSGEENVGNDDDEPKASEPVARGTSKLD
jgi:hypothetical protein